MRAEIVVAVADHCPHIAAHVRPADEEELWAVACLSPLAAMEQSLANSFMAWTGLIDGEPVCMFGVAPADGPGIVARPWMVATERLDRHPLVFLRRCGACVQWMRETCDRLENWVDVRNDRAVDWLNWLGFEIHQPPERIGPFGLPFFRFTMKGQR